MNFAEQVNILFEEVQASDGTYYTSADVCEATGLTHGTLSQLRAGIITNPKLSTLRSIASFFQTPLDYFNCDTPDQCRMYLHQLQMQDKNLVDIDKALRAKGLSVKSVHVILNTISQFERLEGLRGRASAARS